MEYLSDRISVIARGSSFKYKGSEVDTSEAARELGVEAILTGDYLLISTELTGTRDNTQIWGEQYRRKATDLVSTHAEISREIAQKLRLKLTAPEQQQLAKRETAIGLTH